jgi:hypothetical protein
MSPETGDGVRASERTTNLQNHINYSTLRGTNRREREDELKRNDKKSA